MLKTIIVIVLLIAVFAWAVIRRAARMERKQQSDLDKIRHMENAELSDIINQYKQK